MRRLLSHALAGKHFRSNTESGRSYRPFPNGLSLSKGLQIGAAKVGRRHALNPFKDDDKTGTSPI
jgi:hypothetical protein